MPASGAGEQRTARRQRTAVQVWAAWLLGITAVIHLALPLGHSDNWLLTVGFLGSGAAFAWLAVRAWEGRSYRLLGGLLLGATLLAYLLVAGTGKEEPDQVGIVTAMVELLALGLCLVPGRAPEQPQAVQAVRQLDRHRPRSLFVAGAWIWIGSFLSHARRQHRAPTSPEGGGRQRRRIGPRPRRTTTRPGPRPASSCDPAPRTSRPSPRSRRPTSWPAATRTAMAKYANLDDAHRRRLRPARPSAHGPDVHMDNKANASDGRVLDPQRPEKLVYAIDGGKATLLGVVFMMERAGVPGPEPGGSITRWHAHNICLSVLPPGFTIVSAYGTCPPLSITVTSAEMMHVWVVDNPGGWFAEGLDRTWVARLQRAARRAGSSRGRPVGFPA